MLAANILNFYLKVNEEHVRDGVCTYIYWWIIATNPGASVTNTKKLLAKSF